MISARINFEGEQDERACIFCQSHQRDDNTTNTNAPLELSRIQPELLENFIEPNEWDDFCHQINTAIHPLNRFRPIAKLCNTLLVAIVVTYVLVFIILRVGFKEQVVVNTIIVTTWIFFLLFHLAMLGLWILIQYTCIVQKQTQVQDNISKICHEFTNNNTGKLSFHYRRINLYYGGYFDTTSSGSTGGYSYSKHRFVQYIQVYAALSSHKYFIEQQQQNDNNNELVINNKNNTEASSTHATWNLVLDPRDNVYTSPDDDDNNNNNANDDYNNIMRDHKALLTTKFRIELQGQNNDGSDGSGAIQINRTKPAILEQYMDDNTWDDFCNQIDAATIPLNQFEKLEQAAAFICLLVVCGLFLYIILLTANNGEDTTSPKKTRNTALLVLGVVLGMIFVLLSLNQKQLEKRKQLMQHDLPQICDMFSTTTSSTSITPQQQQQQLEFQVCQDQIYYSKSDTCHDIKEEECTKKDANQFLSYIQVTVDYNNNNNNNDNSNNNSSSNSSSDIHTIAQEVTVDNDSDNDDDDNNTQLC